MRPADWLRLLILAAIWGASYLFVRIAAPVIGPAPTATSRLLIGGLLLAALVHWHEGGLHLRGQWRHYGALGMLNSGLPFLLFGFAAQTLPASYLILLNATTPLFGAVVAAIWLGEPLHTRQVLALTSGLAGVGVVAGLGPIELGSAELLAIAAGLGGATCYALATVRIRRSPVQDTPNTQAAMSQLAAGLLILPLALATPQPAVIATPVIVAVLALGFLCSGLAYMLYFRLVVDVGPVRTLIVTFLSPPFGLLWGWLVLDEAITLQMLAGTALILAGTVGSIGKPAKAPSDQSARR
jgi:drug/metabolite transporter (DMT)-like permease